MDGVLFNSRKHQLLKKLITEEKLITAVYAGLELYDTKSSVYQSWTVIVKGGSKIQEICTALMKLFQLLVHALVSGSNSPVSTPYGKSVFILNPPGLRMFISESAKNILPVETRSK